LLAEIGWRLTVPPSQPPATIAVVLGWAVREPSWEPYLGLTTSRAAIAPAV
jgi:hypothetical protein